MNSESKRKQFVKNAVAYLDKYGFEGLDLDIEYPTCPQGDCSGGNPEDKKGFAALIKELHQVFKAKGWVLSADISADPGTIDKAYDIKAMNENLDWVGVMTYDYHTSTEKQTGPVSPLMTTSGDKFPDTNTKNTINHLISKGADKSKLLVGIPFYGYSYKLQSEYKNGYWAPSSGKGPAGPFTKDAGQMSYYEVCDLLKKQGYKNVENSALGAYAFKGNTWVSYNSKKDVLNKVNYVKKTKLGGVIVWDTSFDDFKGKFCGQGKYPLLSTIKKNIN